MVDHDDDRIDFHALDPTADPERFNQRVSAVMARAELLLARRRQQVGALWQLARCQRPVAAAAAVVLLVSFAVLARGTGDAPVTVETGFTEAMGVPTQLVQWMGAEELPSAAELLFSEESN